jgi:hypothetical protein
MFLSYQNKILNLNKTYPLDYIIDMPREQREIKDANLQEGMWRRATIFKNVIMRRINEIRLIRKKPKFTELY